MKFIIPGYKKVFTLLGLLCLLVPIALFVLWSHACDLGSNQAERIEVYHSYLPNFLKIRHATSFAKLSFSALAVIFSAFNTFNFKTNSRFWETLSASVFGLGLLFLYLNLFQMM